MLPSSKDVCCHQFRPDGSIVNERNIRENISSERQRLFGFIEKNFNLSGIRDVEFCHRRTNLVAQVRMSLCQYMRGKIVIMKKSISAAAFVFRQKLQRG